MINKEKIEELKTRLVDNWYDGMDERELEAFFKDAQRDYIDSIEDMEELIDIFKSNGLFDNEDDDEDNNNECWKNRFA